jgi:anti-sigma28 factor (negative regulator of flagellin synthesis)
MVDSIHGGPGKTIIITTKSKPKSTGAVDKTSSFDDELKGKTTSSGEKTTQATMLNSVAQNNLKVIQNQQLMHMQRVQEIARQVADGTYKMCSPEALAEKLMLVMTDKATREKFIKKLIKEETENSASENGKIKGSMTDLELKKLVYLIKESQDSKFDDPELEAMLKELA